MHHKKIIISSLLATLILSGCGSRSEALYPVGKEEQVKVQTVKEFSLLSPQRTVKTHFHILYKAKHTKPSLDDYVNARGNIIDLSKLPTVVIALPVEKRKQGDEASELDRTGEFKTEGYISKSEEAVEKELIRFSFNVIDRSKFEAKLRTTREAKNEDKKTKGDNLYDAQVNILKAQLNNKKITNEEYINKISKLNDASSTRKQGEKELIDMSELIRAAQSNGVQADYILQLNKIEEYNGYLTSLPLKGKKEIEEYLKQNPDLTYGEGPEKIPASFDTKVFRVVFSAKLFNVKSGKVVWTGSHELNSLDIEDITVDFDIIKKDISTLTMNHERSSHNREANKLYQESLNAQRKLKELYHIASQDREYDDEVTQASGERKLKSDIEKYESILRYNNNRIKKLNRDVTNKASNQLKFQYLVTDLYIQPNLNITDNMDPRQKKIIQKHRRKLLSETIRSLFNTIRVRNG